MHLYFLSIIVKLNCSNSDFILFEVFILVNIFPSLFITSCSNILYLTHFKLVFNSIFFYFECQFFLFCLSDNSCWNTAKIYLNYSLTTSKFTADSQSDLYFTVVLLLRREFDGTHTLWLPNRKRRSSY